MDLRTDDELRIGQIEVSPGELRCVIPYAGQLTGQSQHAGILLEKALHSCESRSEQITFEARLLEWRFRNCEEGGSILDSHNKRRRTAGGGV